MSMTTNGFAWRVEDLLNNETKGGNKIETRFIYTETEMPPKGEVSANYSPTQPRDRQGRWSGGGGSSYSTKGGETLYQVRRRKDGTWVGRDGKPAPEHVQKLAIPPAWKKVYVNPNPNGDRLAQGVDKKGRMQTRYSASHNAKAAAAKFGRVRELIKKREQIAKEYDRDAKDPSLRDMAEVAKLIMQTGMRPGSDRDTKADHKSYGATTLEGRHVIEHPDGSVSLRLVTGKNKGREVEFPIRDKRTAQMLLRRAKSAGPGGRLFDVDERLLRGYSKSKDGGGFKVKDHRTALGTETAKALIKPPSPKTEKEYKRRVKEVAAEVAKVLGNTPAVALKSYIDPQVFTAWQKEAGVTTNAFCPTGPGGKAKKSTRNEAVDITLNEIELEATDPFVWSIDDLLVNSSKGG